MMMKKKLITGLCLMLLGAALVSTACAACEKEEDHRYGSWKTKTSATCTRQGHQFKYCQLCDHWEQRRTAKLPHTPGEMTVTKEPTCTETGRQEAICTVCGNLVRYTMDKLEHNYGEMTVVTEPTCAKDGKGEYACVDCGRKKTTKIERLGHDWTDYVITREPTCTKAGASEETCARCGKTQTDKVDTLEHVFGKWTVTREPSGKRKGLRERACTLCGKTDEENFYPEGMLYEGMEPNGDVLRMQEMLRDLGYYNGSIRSGQFGQLTTTAVARFQREHELTETGLADEATRERIVLEWEKARGQEAVDRLDASEMLGAAEAQTIAQ